ncbi:conjugal transfer pilus assembly protein TraB [Sphingobium sp. B1D7B]|uniref:TraB/VirB10 family protein n=1 Tax=Sphingobium sp. B1D7B TaxID=2940578 RepID=UPI0022258E36|nr:TraB/VirB10 family protein [Sphingobium sp. B1D7B]MCW2406893.1 conjugal transfer pilus assembly protein TraB [Sphingobium sp. B1D7B]
MAGMLDFLKRRDHRPHDGASGDTIASIDMTANDDALRRQRLILAGGSAIAIAAAMWWLFSGRTPANQDPNAQDMAAADVQISTGELGTRNLSEKEWIAMSENRLQAQAGQLDRLQGQGDQLSQLQAQVEALRAQNASMESDGRQVLSAYESENAALRSQLSAAQTAPAPVAGTSSLYGQGGPQAYQSPDGPVRRPGELKVINFGASAPASGGTPAASAPSRPGAVLTDSPNYLPANSFARARVIVGVDAASNVQSQSDPLPVVLRITSPARSVADGQKVFKTRIEGCLVNGSARGDLSSEKVYVKLARMTCPDASGRYAESEVKGFIAFGGKTGVRGRVVSREGNLAMQAFLAGIVGGVGRGFSMNTNSYLSGTNTIVDGKRQKLSPGDIAQAGLGEGISTSGDRVSNYLIERAEQYQPVIEMPTGIDVEIVFLEGAFVRN